jgi:hypothetical protein
MASAVDADSCHMNVSLFFNRRYGRASMSWDRGRAATGVSNGVDATGLIPALHRQLG